MYQARRRPSARMRARFLGVVVLIAVLVAAYVIVQLVRPVPALRAVSSLPATVEVPAAGWSLPFTPGPQQVVSIAGVGDLGSIGGSRPIPIASVTKVMSALVVLHDHPLAPGDAGPLLTVTPADVATYRQQKAAQDSVVAVQAGEQLSELQALQAALIPSADNVVDLLARWDAGSVPAFVAKMNAEAARLGLAHTHYVSPDGVDPGSASTAGDQVRLAAVAMTNPVFASIVAEPQVVLPVAGLQYNVDGDLGSDGVIGVKTGWIPQGGASFVFAADDRVGGRNVRVIGAVIGDQGTPALPSALSQALALVRGAHAGLVLRQVVARNELVGSIVSGRGSPVPLRAAASARVVAWRGAVLAQRVQLSDRLGEQVRTGERVGTLVVSLGDEQVRVPVVAAASLPAPSIGWRLGRL